MQPEAHQRILAVDLRTGRFGFAILEGPHELLEWGARRWYPTSVPDPAAFLRRSLAPLIRLNAPSVIAVKIASPQGNGRNSQYEHLLKIMNEEAERQSVASAFVGRNEIRSVFAPSGKATKHAIATRVAKQFPELVWNLPPVRKAWTIEAHSMMVFDAVSIGLTYFARFGEVFPNTLQESPVVPPG